ncbi:heparinase II/III family protein [Polaromonas sp. JS666]|uniref:heparinase II/III domain-containing protein n=1 Tax=Polaromonas sp. (strain JS666 / ATCC BAA-500) TaxID=296591 RepID=UPI0009F57B4E|nr:heparinase II/III family protein [Polaromonas sp. JS666]
MPFNRREVLAAMLPATAPLAGCGSMQAVVESPPTEQVQAHPPLLASESDWSSLADRCKADPDLGRFNAALLARARSDMALPSLEHTLEDGRLLGVSREFIRRSLQWAFAYRVTRERVFLDRARQEMLAVAAFSDWHPDHYLDLAEMTTGMAISYSWLFNDLSDYDRAALRTAMVDKGIAQARKGHITFRSTNNWNQVCIGGMVLGALAVEDDEPALAADLLAAAHQGVFIGLKAYRPDGVYPEGPDYWSYGSSYTVLLAAALRGNNRDGSTDRDWGLLDAPGFKRSAEFYAHAIGPSGKYFNFADSNEGQELPCAIVYLARELDQPALVTAKRQMIRDRQGLSDRFAPLSVLWWPTKTGGNTAPTSFSGQGAQPLAIWRSSWSDPNAWWFAIKAGGAAHSHAHMDAGSFVLDLDGLRWAKDLGMQDYSSLESRGIDLWNMKPGSSRWRVFRLSAEAHNTLTLDGQAHSARGMATLRMVAEREALIDLTPALLPGQVTRATRRARFLDDAVQLDDELLGARPDSTVRWAMATEAEVRLEGTTAFLAQKGKRLTVQFEGNAIQLDVLDISAPRRDFDQPNPNVRQLVVSGKPKADGSWKLATRFSRG